MSILIIKSGTTSIEGATVKGDFTYFSATTKGLGATINTGFWSGVDPTCDGYTVYKIGGQNGWAAMVATGREQLNYYLKLFGGTGTTVDENVTWATNANNIFLHSGSTGPCPTPTPTSINCVTSVSFDVDSVGDVTYLTCCGVLVYLTVGLGPQVINDCLQFGSLSVTDAIISNISYGTTPCICTTPTPTPTPTSTPVVTYPYLGRTNVDAGSPANACADYLTVRPYTINKPSLASITVGDRFYDSYPTTPTNGGNNWIALKSSGVGTAYSFQIDTSGYVIQTGGPCL
jgi:hypothetical protein